MLGSPAGRSKRNRRVSILKRPVAEFIELGCHCCLLHVDHDPEDCHPCAYLTLWSQSGLRETLVWRVKMAWHALWKGRVTFADIYGPRAMLKLATTFTRAAASATQVEIDDLHKETGKEFEFTRKNLRALAELMEQATERLRRMGHSLPY